MREPGELERGEWAESVVMLVLLGRGGLVSMLRGPASGICKMLVTSVTNVGDLGKGMESGGDGHVRLESSEGERTIVAVALRFIRG